MHASFPATRQKRRTWEHDSEDRDADKDLLDEVMMLEESIKSTKTCSRRDEFAPDGSVCKLTTFSIDALKYLASSLPRVLPVDHGDVLHHREVSKSAVFVFNADQIQGLFFENADRLAHSKGLIEVTR